MSIFAKMKSQSAAPWLSSWQKYSNSTVSGSAPLVKTDRRDGLPLIVFAQDDPGKIE
ncbi:MAG: hypothetical protein Q8P60_14140 [Pseudorhodobacter sp.]|nr:hypothetical protein [Pseudorhodobacter sp.]